MQKDDTLPEMPLGLALGASCRCSRCPEIKSTPACSLDLLLPEKIWTRSLQLIEQGQVQCFVAQSSRRKVFLVSSQPLLQPGR